jgi:hypothetical protein
LHKEKQATLLKLLVFQENKFNLGGKNEEILVGFSVTRADYGLQCIGLCGRCQG